MKISNEIKVGVLAVVAILVLILGFNFLKGKSFFKKENVLYAEFTNIGSLEKSNQVKINGLDIGKVYGVRAKDKEVNSIIVEIHVEEGILIPKNSVAFIDGSLVGAAFINVTKGDLNQYLQSGDTITTKISGSLLANLQTQMQPTIIKVNETLDSLKNAIGGISAIFDPTTNGNLQTLIARLTVTSAHLQDILNAQSGALASSLQNVNSVTGNLARNNDAVTASIRNIEVTTGNLANARLPETIAALEGTITELKSSAAGLRSTIDKLNSPNGTVGALLNDKKAYDNLNKVLLSAEILLDDLRLHPKRYVNISLIGGRSKPDPITSPALKDTTARVHD